MIETFWMSFRLRNTYRKNGILYSLHSLPLLKRLPQSLYASGGLRVFADVIAGIAEVLSVFTGKALYLLLIFTQAMAMNAPSGDSFAHMLLFLTVIGGLLNTNIFNPTKDKFYAMFLLRMNAREYTLANYFYFLLKMLVGCWPFSFLFGLLCGASPLTCLCVPLYVIGVKLCCTAVNLAVCRRQSRTMNENKLTPMLWGGVIALLAAAAVPYFGFALPEETLWGATAAVLLPAAFFLRYIVRFDAYRPIYKELLKPELYFGSGGTNAIGAAQQLAMQKKLTVDSHQTSSKTGYALFHDLFIKRHARLLTRSAKRMTLIVLALLGAAVVALQFYPAAKPEVNELLLTYLPYFLFVMYLMNRGKVITQAMFMNCDHSMLAYRFYRQPKALLALFVMRLRYVVLINLLPASVIAVGLPLLLFLSGGTAEPLHYVVLFISILAMSVFFSVHHMVLYYLLQPYNVNLESRNAAYGVINAVTYIVCYSAIQVKLPTLAFGTAISVFCVVYAAVAILLAYRLAPRTFRLRQ